MDLDRDKILGDYLLGKLSEEEELRLEAEYLADAGRREQIEAVETELVDAYLSGELSDVERRALETRLLASPRGQRRLELARTWKTAVPTGRPARTSRVWLLTAAALLAAAGLTMLGRVSLPDRRPQGTEVADGAWHELYAGVHRGAGADVTIAVRSPGVRLLLHLDRDVHDAYEVALADTDWRQTGVRGERIADGTGLRVTVPAARLAAGKEYTLVVSPASAPERPMRAYAFRVAP